VPELFALVLQGAHVLLQVARLCLHRPRMYVRHDSFMRDITQLARLTRLCIWARARARENECVRERKRKREKGPRIRVWMEDNSSSITRMFSRIVVIWMVWPSHTAVCSIFDPFSTAIPEQETSSTHTHHHKLAQTSTHYKQGRDTRQ